MVSASLSRRLAAVLIADVAGYSRLMERDESGTHVRIRALLAEVVEPAIAENHGRLLHIVGDGVLAEFPSATDAVRCAVSVQRQCAVRSADVVASDRIALRIGINVADVLYDESDIAGGGVDLAARLETLHRPAEFASLKRFGSRFTRISASLTLMPEYGGSRTSANQCGSCMS